MRYAQGCHHLADAQAGGPCGGCGWQVILGAGGLAAGGGGGGGCEGGAPGRRDPCLHTQPPTWLRSPPQQCRQLRGPCGCDLPPPAPTPPPPPLAESALRHTLGPAAAGTGAGAGADGGGGGAVREHAGGPGLGARPAGVMPQQAAAPGPGSDALCSAVCRSWPSPTACPLQAAGSTSRVEQPAARLMC